MTLGLSACGGSAAPTAAPTSASSPAAAASKPAGGSPAASNAAPASGKPIASAAGKPSGEPLKIGLISSFSGPSASAGTMQSLDMDIALEKIDAQGGVNGHPIQIIKEDAQLDPQGGVTALRKLAEQDKVLAVIGPVSSGQWDVAAPLANQLQVVDTNVNATKDDSTKPPWAFRLAGVDSDMAPIGIAGYHKQYPQVKKVVIVGDIREASSEYSVHQSYPKVLKELGFTILDTLGFPTGQTDFSAIVTKAKSLQPEGVITSMFLAEGLGLQKEMERQGLTVPAFTGPVLWALPFAPLSTKAASGWTNMGFYDVSPEADRAEARQFYDDYVKRTASINTVPKPLNVANNPVAYDPLLLYADIMRKANITPQTPVQEARTMIRDGLRAMKNYQGVGALWKDFKPSGDVNVDIFPLILDKDKGRWVRLK